jgi:hypothetical protein
MKDKGLTPEEIEKIYKDNGKIIPTVKITAGKLTGLQTGSDKKNDIRLIFENIKVLNDKKEEIDKKVVTGMNYTGSKPNNGKNSLEYTTGNDEIITFDNAKTVIYDLLYDNGRIFYNPTEDINARIKKKQLILPYATTINNNQTVYLVPYTRVYMRKPEKKKNIYNIKKR